MSADDAAALIQPGATIGMSGSTVISNPSFNDDLRYARDLGPIASDAPVRVANPIYR